jgi:chromosomal replication initiator protein
LKEKKNDGLNAKEVVKYIAYNINSNVRELECFNFFVGTIFAKQEEIDLDCEESVAQFLWKSSKEITIETIQRMVCDFLTCHTANCQKTRKREIIQARQITVPGKSFTKTLSRRSANISVVAIIRQLSIPAKQ